MRIALDKLRPAPWNPREIRSDRFKNLCASIEADPGLLDLRPVLATLDGMIYGGNHRYRAVKHLGWTDVPAVLSDIPKQLAKERGMRDNGAWADWQDESLGALLAELKDAGSDLDLLGFEPASLDRLLGTAVSDDPLAEWQDMPAFEQEDQTGFSAVVVHFLNETDMLAFAALVGQPITKTTKSLWHPQQQIVHNGAVVITDAA